MEKLNYIQVLCEYLIELAKSRFNPFLQNNINKNARKNSIDQFTMADNSFKKAEQLVIYLKCLQLLKPVLSYAKDELMLKHLKSTSKVKKIMRQLNNMYKFCLSECRQTFVHTCDRVVSRVGHGRVFWQTSQSKFIKELKKFFKLN